MDADQPPQWRGAAIHGFMSEQHLMGAIRNASRYLTGPEQCALLMNGARFVRHPPPLNSEGHRDFEFFLVSADGYALMEDSSTVMVNGRRGWLFYKEEEVRSFERNCGFVKVNSYYQLARLEVSGELRLRRRVFLPAELLAQANGEVFYVLQYSLYPNQSALVKANIMAALAGGEE